MIATQEIVYGVTGQSLIFDCPDGRPSAVVSVAVYATEASDTSTAETATTGAASVEANPDTTLAAAASIGAVTVQLTVTTGVTVGRRYVLAAASGLSEEVEVAALASPVVTLRHPLINAYPITTSTFKSTRSTISIDSTWAADMGNLSRMDTPNPGYRVRWVVTLSGVSQVYDRYFDLVRYPARHNVSPLDVERRHPGWLDGLPTDFRDDQGRALIDRAWQKLKRDLSKDGKADQALRNSELVADLVITRTILLRNEDAFFAGAIDPERLAAARDLYAQSYTAAIRSPVAPIDLSGGGASSTISPSRLWVR